MLSAINHVGDRYAITIPKEMLDKLRLTAGAQVDVQLEDGTGRIVIQAVDAKAGCADIDAEFASQVSDFIEKYRPALEKLAK